ncbi:unnamed protein product [Lampetra fluviatilis]
MPPPPPPLLLLQLSTRLIRLRMLWRASSQSLRSAHCAQLPVQALCRSGALTTGVSNVPFAMGEDAEARGRLIRHWDVAAVDVDGLTFDSGKLMAGSCTEGGDHSVKNCPDAIHGERTQEGPRQLSASDMATVYLVSVEWRVATLSSVRAEQLDRDPWLQGAKCPDTKRDGGRKFDQGTNTIPQPPTTPI